MINILNVIDVLKEKCKIRFKCQSTTPTNLEIDIAENLVDLFYDIANNCKIKKETALVLKNEMHPDINFKEIESLSQQLSQQSTGEASLSSQYTNTDSVIIENECFSFEYMADVVKFVEKHPTYSFKTIQHHYRRIKHRNYITRFKEYVANFGTQISKLQELKNNVFEGFRMARVLGHPVHDIDIQKWAINSAKTLHISNFQASTFWLHKFKLEHGIVSRKVTKVVSNILEDGNIQVEVEIFLKHANGIISQIDSSCVLNTDQSGFQYELYSQRTLSNSGEKIQLLL